ncbi:MAG: lipocalin-like domain-containing protein [Candidatus Acidiferrales bacterium]
MENAKIIGTWNLISASSSTPKGERIGAPYGANPVGLLTYTQNGRVAVTISYDGRKPLSLSSSIEDQAEAYKTFVGYAGRYVLGEGRITHFIEVSSIQSYVNKELVRFIALDGDRINLVTPPTLVNGKIQTIQLCWEHLVTKS